MIQCYHRNIKLSIFRVFDPVLAACTLQDYNEVRYHISKIIQMTYSCHILLCLSIQSVRGLAASTLGSILGTYTLSSLLSAR